MLTTFFYLIVVPSILAFFLGYIAHGLKIMTQTPLEAKVSGSNFLDSTFAKKATESTLLKTNTAE